MQNMIFFCYVMIWNGNSVNGACYHTHPGTQNGKSTKSSHNLRRPKQQSNWTPRAYWRTLASYVSGQAQMTIPLGRTVTTKMGMMKMSGIPPLQSPHPL